jgi:hypothetical protein
MGSALTPDMSALDPALAGFLADRLVFAGVEDEPVDLRAYIERMG